MEHRSRNPVAEPVDPDEFLKKCHAPTFKAYLHWRCKNSRIKKESSITTYWKVLSMFYSDKCGTWLDGKVLFDVGNVISLLIPFDLRASLIKSRSGFLLFSYQNSAWTARLRTRAAFTSETWI